MPNVKQGEGREMQIPALSLIAAIDKLRVADANVSATRNGDREEFRAYLSAKEEAWGLVNSYTERLRKRCLPKK
jgi:hypothetical protein